MQVASESLTALRTVQSYNAQPHAERLFGTRVDGVLRLVKREALASGVFFGIMGWCGNIVVVGLLVCGMSSHFPSSYRRIDLSHFRTRFHADGMMLVRWQHGITWCNFRWRSNQCAVVYRICWVGTTDTHVSLFFTWFFLLFTECS
jgi:ABC-type multidrug transport system fused ATPase/permease subunit